MLYYSPSLFIENCKIHFIINQLQQYVHVDVKYKKFIAVIRFSEDEIYHMQLMPSIAYMLCKC